ncbi:unnamed protein product [marine sediment metagenome]|uniref:Uncharacterized protein n=1 Tax=marine sediment metagenome TaxID=412755 RepID=X0VIA8_9ZZZZ
MGKIFGIKSDQVHDFILKEQEKDPPKNQTKWKVKFLNVGQSAKVSDMIYSATGFGKKREELLKAGTQSLMILRLGLSGWENFTYEDGKEVSWEPPTGNTNNWNTIMDRNLDKIPPEYRDEISDHIRGGSSLDQD